MLEIAIVPTACGIETEAYEPLALQSVAFVDCNSTYRLRYWNAVLLNALIGKKLYIAIVPTACGIETRYIALGV